LDEGVDQHVWIGKLRAQSICAEKDKHLAASAEGLIQWAQLQTLAYARAAVNTIV